MDTLTSRYFIRISGIVQGVGFRPFIYRLAKAFGINGNVCNTSGTVEIIAEGPDEKLDSFLQAIRDQAPRAARIENIQVEKMAATGVDVFKIVESRQTAGYQPLSPDLATCVECASEILDPLDRRYKYPFTNCTNCGPRFTIIEDIPYDRSRTTMKDFIMCPSCRAEYENPEDRRFHAQPNACPVCGPSLAITDRSGEVVSPDPIETACRLLEEGRILAIKGLGGFLLACDATSDEAVNLLRTRKARPSKPFAIMAADLGAAGRLCEISPEEEKLLCSSASPIVLLKKKPGCRISGEVAPGNSYLGIMLPYTPLHHLLLAGLDIPLVMTSGNLSEEPIAKDNDEALSRLSGLADYFLLHDRGIYSRYDDSVVFWGSGAPRVIRRARGYAPEPVKLDRFIEPVLGVGAQMKNTFCLAKGHHAFLSQYIGDLDNIEAMEHYRDTLAIYKHLFRIEPEMVACDMHPEYASSLYAEELANERGLQLVRVQHHHAHIASLLAESGLAGPVIGVAMDGTGLGTDGTIWGGEFMLADRSRFNRLAHLEYLPLPGGDAGTRNPYRIAAAYLYHFFGREAENLYPLYEKLIEPEEMEILVKQLDAKINTPLTSSCGRLFDAVSALLGLRRTVSYEAQAAIDLEMAATGSKFDAAAVYPFETSEHNGCITIGLARLFDAILRDIARGKSIQSIAFDFHCFLAEMIFRISDRLSHQTGIKTVALSGGVFQNRLLLGMAIDKLEQRGLRVITHKWIPSNDSCIALGQVVSARAERL